MRIWLVLALTFAALAKPASGGELSGEKRVVLEGAGGERLEIATLSVFGPEHDLRYRLSFAEAPFGDYFLSMRPFRCLDGAVMICHLPYPYEKENRLQPGDFSALECNLLFIVRAPDDYGIDPYEGRYFPLRPDAGGLSGQAHAVDLNILAAPPEAGVTRPIGPGDLEPLEAEGERFSRIVIR